MNLDDGINWMTQQQSQKFDFDPIADSYDSWYDSERGLIYDRLEKQAIDKLMVGVAKGSRLLEVGCGTGHWCEYFSDKGFDVTGIDISAKMIEIARRKHIPNSRFEIADGRNLPFKDESFDIAAAITVLEFTPEPQKIVSEMVRCIKKDKGLLVIGVLNALNKYNQKRKNKPGSVYRANLFSPQLVQNVLSQYGIISMQITGYVPEKDWLLGLSPLWEHLGCLFKPQIGAFIAARV